MEEFIVDLSGATDIRSLHQLLQEALPLPPWYGGNLDALYDALTDFAGGVRICVTGYEDLPENLQKYYSRLVRVLRDAEAETPDLTVRFAARGDKEEKPAQTECGQQYTGPAHTGQTAALQETDAPSGEDQTAAPQETAPSDADQTAAPREADAPADSEQYDMFEQEADPSDAEQYDFFEQEEDPWEKTEF